MASLRSRSSRAAAAQPDSETSTSPTSTAASKSFASSNKAAGARAPLTKSTFAKRQPAEGGAPFTLDDIKRAIPKHCFERPLYKSFGYLFYDLAVIAVIVFCSLFFKQAAIRIASLFSIVFGLSQEPLAALVADSALAGAAAPYASAAFALPGSGSVLSLFGETAHALFSQPLLAALASPQLFVYCAALTALTVTGILAQGAVMTGVWVIGHECGHGGFSDNRMIGDVVGLIFHTMLFVPYYSWAITHRTHHSNNANIDLDEVHVPEHINYYMPLSAHGALHHDKHTAGEAPVEGAAPSAMAFLSEVNKILSDFNLFHRCISTFFTVTIGWILYLTINASGRRYENKSRFPVNHFNPDAPIFRPQERLQVTLSTVALLAWFFILYRIIAASSLTIVAVHFLFPYLVVQYWLVVITLLQHTHTALPRYSTASWDYVRGALATVDRDYGAVWNWTLHNINDTHVVHHLFSYMPHYHAMEATEAVKELLGDWYVRTEDDKPAFGVLRSLWKSIRECNFVAEDDHPALALADSAIRGLKSGASAEAVAAEVEAAKEKAFAEGPHAGGRNASKEVYWFRTIDVAKE